MERDVGIRISMVVTIDKRSLLMSGIQASCGAVERFYLAIAGWVWVIIACQ